jgi:hypothetical protein
VLKQEQHVISAPSGSDIADETSKVEKHRLVIVCVRGNVSVRETMRSILRDSVDPAGLFPIYLLGPTAPEDLPSQEKDKVAWITFVDGTTCTHPSPGVEIISPDNLLEVNLFIEKAVQAANSHVLVGDFLDNVIKTAGSPESFYSFFCQLASRVKMRKRTAILVIKEDIHDRAIVEIVKRFADVVLEVRDQENEGSLKVEMRTLNFADNVYTSWRPFSEALRPIATEC